MIEIKLINNNTHYYNDLLYILKVTDKDFVPSISEKTKLEDVAKKYIDLAYCFIAYVDNKPAGFVSFYCNEFPQDSYLSLIAVCEEFRGLQIGMNLELECIKYCKENKSNGLNLNMRKSNTRLYESRLKLGYKVIKEYHLPYSDELIVDMHLSFL